MELIDIREEAQGQQSGDLSGASICFLKLNPGISITNFVAFLFMQFVIYMTMSFVLSFVVFILSDPNYYDVK